jgi:hypothetical protein
MDESGKMADSDFVCLSAYIAGDDAWNKFSEEWANLLRFHDIPYVHMKEAMALSGPYEKKGWDTAKRNSVLAEFALIIRKTIWAGFGVAVDAKYFRQMPSEARKKMGDAQIFCFQRMIHLVIQKLREVGYEPRISMVFDDSEEYSTRCYRVWSRLRVLRPEIRDRIPAITFADDRVFNPLQAADMLAWESNKSLRLRAANEEQRPQLRALMTDTDPSYGLDYVGEVWGAKSLDKIWAQIKAGPPTDRGARPVSH